MSEPKYKLGDKVITTDQAKNLVEQLKGTVIEYNPLFFAICAMENGGIYEFQDQEIRKLTKLELALK